MKRDKLVNKIAKAIAKTDNEYLDMDPIPWGEESDYDRDHYILLADAALRRLAKEFRKWPLGEWGNHDIADELVDFLAGDFEEYVELDKRSSADVSIIVDEL